MDANMMVPNGTKAGPFEVLTHVTTTSLMLHWQAEYKGRMGEINTLIKEQHPEVTDRVRVRFLNGNEILDENGLPATTDEDKALVEQAKAMGEGAVGKLISTRFASIGYDIFHEDIKAVPEKVKANTKRYRETLSDMAKEAIPGLADSMVFCQGLDGETRTVDLSSLLKTKVVTKEDVKAS